MKSKSGSRNSKAGYEAPRGKEMPCEETHYVDATDGRRMLISETDLNL